MPDDPTNIRLPSISEWMPEEPSVTRTKPYHTAQTQLTHIRNAHSPQPLAAQVPPLRERADSSASSGAPPSKKSPTTAQLPLSTAYNNSYGCPAARSQGVHHNPARRFLPPHQQARVAGVDHDAMDVDAPHGARRPARGSAPSSYSILHHDPHSGKLENIASNSAYSRGSRSPTSPTRSGMVNGSDPIFRVPPLHKVGPQAERPQQGSGSGSPSSMDVDPRHMIISFPTAPISPAASRYTLVDRSENRDSGVDDSATHGGETGKKHICPVCSSRFNRPSSLRIHINTHTGETPFKCPWPDCGREFNVNSNMRRHYRNHASPGSSRNGREGGTQKRRRRRMTAPSAGEYTPNIPVPGCHTIRQQQNAPHASGNQHQRASSFNPPPISTLSVREGSFAGGGTSESEDGDGYGPCDSEDIDELSEDDFRGSSRVTHRPASPHIVSPSTASSSPVSSPSLSASSSTSPYSRASASLSPPPPLGPHPRSLHPFLMQKQEPGFEARILIRGDKHRFS
ncbi:C2H2-type domain-containing protein [Pleurotus pulmonarius]